MIAGQYWKLHDDDTIRKIDLAAIRLLTGSGARIEHDGLLDRLESAGCRIERAARRCYFTERLIRDALHHLGNHQCAKEAIIAPGWNPQARLWHGGSYPHLLEWPSGRRRLATRQDVVDLAKMAHSLDEFPCVGRVFNTSEVNPRIEPLWTTLQLAQITNKAIGGGEIFYPGYIEPLVRMGEVLSGKQNATGLIASCDFFIAPLILDPNQAACFLEKRRFGMPNCPGTMPISGMSAPVTIAGTVALAIAELMAGWVLGYVVNPDLPAGGIVSSGSLDMRTLSACFGSPEAMLQDTSVVNICQRLYGISVDAAIGYTDCKRPGTEASFLKMFGLLGMAMGAGKDLPATGLLSAGQDYSPVQHMLDLEMSKAVERFWGHYEVNDDTLGVSLIEQIMRAGSTNFLDTEHTLAHFKAEQWYPRWLDRSPWQGETYELEAEARMMERIDRYCREAIRNYQPPEIAPATIKELKRIFLAAERTLAGSNITCL